LSVTFAGTVHIARRAARITLCSHTQQRQSISQLSQMDPRDALPLVSIVLVHTRGRAIVVRPNIAELHQSLVMEM